MKGYLITFGIAVVAAGAVVAVSNKTAMGRKVLGATA